MENRKLNDNELEHVSGGAETEAERCRREDKEKKIEEERAEALNRAKSNYEKTRP